MPFPQIGQRTAAAAGQGFGYMADMLMGLNDREQQAADKEQQRKDALAAQKLANDLAMKRLEVMQQKNEPTGDLDGFGDWLNKNPDATLAEQNLAAMRYGVAGTKDAKNFLGTQGKVADIGYRKDEAAARQSRFSDALTAKKEKALSDYEFAERKWKEQLNLAERELDEKKANNLRQNALGYARIAADLKKSITSYSNRGGLIIDNDEELLAASREVEDNERLLEEMRAKQSKALPDAMLSKDYDALLRQNEALKKEITRYSIEKGGPESISTMTTTSESSSTPLGLTPPVQKKPKPVTITPVKTMPAPAANQNDPLGLFNR